MTIATDTLINHYKITSLLGVGGMGEVYKAFDTKLDRAVALKILPAHLVEDADRVRRFVQEAKSASALNHPHIVTIYEIGQVSAKEIPGASDGSSENGDGVIHYIAMEFVEGETLHAKIHRKKIDQKKTLEFLAQVADGLSKAHTAGIVHRDLKPENVMVTEDGYAKILDFGLAKLVETSSAPSPSSDELEEAATAMMNQTRPGMVMGTIGYMSPEQVQGQSVDQRSDIFSFGCILYEAATGIKPFSGDSLIDSLHKIVYMQVAPIKDSNPNAPSELQRIIRKCLAKSPDERYQSIKDAAIDIRDLLKEYDSLPSVSGAYAQPAPSSGYSHTVETASQPSLAVTEVNQQSFSTGPQSALITDSNQAAAIATAPKKKSWVVYAAAAAVAVAIVLALTLFIRQKNRGDNSSSAQQGKLSAATAFLNPKMTKLTTTGKSVGAVISPDGKYIAYFMVEEGQPSLWIRNVATSSNERKLPPANVGFKGLSFSPDSNYIYYVSGEQGATVFTLYQVPVFAGTPKKVLEDVDSPVSFSPDGKRMAFIRGYPKEKETSLIVINSDGTGEQKLISRKLPESLLDARWSPDGSVIACVTRSFKDGPHVEVLAVGVADGAEKQIGTQQWGIIRGISWLPDGSGIVLSGRELAMGTLQFQIYVFSYPGGELRKITNDIVNYTGVSVSSDTSSLVTIQSDSVANIWAMKAGDAEPHPITTGSGKNVYSVWTPDGKIVYVSDAGGNLDLWIMDADGTNQKQITSDASIDIGPTISPDGRYIVYCSNRGANPAAMSLWRIDMDGGNAKQLTTGATDFWPAFSADGKWIYYNPLASVEKPTLWKVSIDGGEPVKVTEVVALQARISPDGKLMSYWYFPDQSASKPKLAIAPIEGGAPINSLDIPTNIGEFVSYQWTADGKGIAYTTAQGGVPNLFVQPISGGAPKQVTNFKTDLMFNFSISRDGKQTIFSRGNESTDVILIRGEAKK